jgi:hypothetical protein
MTPDLKATVSHLMSLGLIPKRKYTLYERADKPMRLTLPCVHLGEPIGAKVCKDRRVHRCVVYGRCTLTPCAAAANSCEGGKGRLPCESYVPATSPVPARPSAE